MKIPAAIDDTFIRSLAPPEFEAAAKRQPPSRRRKRDCADCGVELGFNGNGHYYMVHDHVWLQAGPMYGRELCLDCLQVRLGRSLSPADFLFTPFEMFERMWPHLNTIKDRLSMRRACSFTEE
jgi:hypothetical protein